MRKSHNGHRACKFGGRESGGMSRNKNLIYSTHAFYSSWSWLFGTWHEIREKKESKIKIFFFASPFSSSLFKNSVSSLRIRKSDRDRGRRGGTAWITLECARGGPVFVLRRTLSDICYLHREILPLLLFSPVYRGPHVAIRLCYGVVRNVWTARYLSYGCGRRSRAGCIQRSIPPPNHGNFKSAM